MKKTVIAALVAKDLEAEFKRYTNSELQFIANVNDGQYGECKPLPEPTEGQLAEAFESQRFDWWRKLFNQRVTLDEAAGMLLGFSQIMAMNAKFVDAHKSNSRAPSRPVSSYLVKAFTDMRGDIADWRVPSDGKYRAADLIAWAKEKGYVADEVLAAWEAKAKPQTKKQERRWTPEFLKEVEAYRSTHTEAATAKQFGVSGSLVRGKLKNHKESNKPKPPSPFAGLGKR